MRASFERNQQPKTDQSIPTASARQAIFRSAAVSMAHCEALGSAGHDVSTVPHQRLQQPMDFPSIAALRLPTQPALNVLDQLVRTLIGGLASESLAGRLWIVEIGRLRIYQSE